MSFFIFYSLDLNCDSVMKATEDTTIGGLNIRSNVGNFDLLFGYPAA